MNETIVKPFREPDDELEAQLPAHFVVCDADTANWVIRRVNEARAYFKRIKEWADQESRRARREETFFLKRFGGELETWLQAELEARNSKQKSINLPAGRIGTRQTIGKLVIYDEQLVLDWARRHCPAAIQTVERLAKQTLNEHFESTGELPDGTSLEPPHQQLLYQLKGRPMSDSSNYPKFFRDFIGSKLECPVCRQTYAFSDFLGTGVGRSDTNSSTPCAMVYAYCQKCKKISMFTTRSDKRKIVIAVASLYDMIESDFDTDLETELDEEHEADLEAMDPDDVLLPSPNFPHGYLPTNRFLDDDTVKHTPAEKAFKQRRRYFHRKLSNMPGDREYNAFLNTLKKTSLKRSTKSFRNFMKNFGIDVDLENGGLPND